MSSPENMPRKRFSLGMTWKYFSQELTYILKHAESKSEKFPLRKPADFLQIDARHTRKSKKFQFQTIFEKTVRVHESDKPWMTGVIKTKIKQQHSSLQSIMRHCS